ncbi:MarR family winged helix-turn-helix transcriptional regulator [Undibacterium sp. TJN19]|uniref:MarR family winged helix-turn-helix transcriptional regulator n=1 Tax=Undibacterium sp. TJN19 TaxID=3413055 RepID=UPI003BF1D29E
MKPKNLSKSLPEAEATLGTLLRRPYEHMSEWLYAELVKHGFDDVRPAFSAVLRNLPANGARVVDLAQRAGMTKQSMGYLVDQMLAAGLVEIAPDLQDRRANTVRLTNRGEAVVATGIALSKLYESNLAQLVGEAKLAQLRSTLHEIYQLLDEPALPA